MKMNRLGKTDLMVSELCLGTMTYGNQTPESDAHTQMDMALDAGINFIDAAEMYPVNPVAKETIGLTEEILGNWFKNGSSQRMASCNQAFRGRDGARSRRCADFKRDNSWSS